MQSEPARRRPKSRGDRILALFPYLGRHSKQAIDSDWALLDVGLAKLENAMEVFPPLKTALSGLREVIQHTEISKQSIEEYGRIGSELQAQITTLQKYVEQSKPTWMVQSIDKIARSLEEENRFIRAQQGIRGTGRIESAMRDESRIIQSYRRIESLFRQLQTDISFNTWNAVRELHMASLLDKLVPAPSAQYDAVLSAEAYRTGCTDGTRESLIGDLLEWANNLDTFKLYWMNGMPGTGKTTIAYTLCKKLESTRQLSACFFCSHISPDCRDVNRVFPTIAHQLAQFSNPYRNGLFEVLNETSNIAQRSVAAQFENLILKPLLLVKDALPTDIVVVIDALDECSSGGEQVLALLLKNATQLPIKFFVTSRPEPSITQQMKDGWAGSTHEVFYLHEIEKSFVQRDITIYLRHAFEESKVLVTPQDIDRLAAYAGNLFIVAATMVRYIIGHGSAFPTLLSRERTEATLAMIETGAGTERQHAVIDSLYTGILEKVLGQLEEHEAAEILRVLWATLCVREPLTIETIVQVLAMRSNMVYVAIKLLQSVLHLSEATGMVSTFHASFPDFMFSKERAGRFYCHQGTQEDHLVRNCFDLMAKQLRFNICELKSSYQLDKNIEDLKSRVDTYITPELFYACRYWADHLKNAPPSEEIANLLRTFLYEHLLFWIETINLKGWVSGGGSAMQDALTWLMASVVTRTYTDLDLIGLQNAARDAQNLVTSFSASEVSQSTPHLYLSSLPASSIHSSLFAHHRQKFQRLPGILTSPTLGSRGASALAVWTIGSNILSTAVSPDGTHLALSRYDGSIHVMDIRRGEIVLEPRGGHTLSGPIHSVAFSSNGSRLASGSANGTICMWNATNGDLLAGPIREHTQLVRIVTFSKSNVLASASDDGYICLWDIHDSKPPTLRFKSRSSYGWIAAITFSPDGSQFASAGADPAIRIQSTETGSIHIAPLQGHNEPVICLCFSLDGSRLASASRDMTVRVWQPQDGALFAGPFQVDLYDYGFETISLSPDPQGALLAYTAGDATIGVISTLTGDLVSGPFIGHTADINSVHFLPGGTHIVSGSIDGTVRIWDAQYNAVEPAATHPGHTQVIRSVAFSPDGVHIASSSNDQIICIWDATSGALVRKLTDGHTHIIRTVMFSSDGEQLASCSDDWTICIWNPHSGTLLRGPLTDHESWVYTIDFSPEGSQLVSGSGDHTIRIWDLQDDDVSSESLTGHTTDVNSVKFSPDGTLIVSGDDNGNVGLWDAQKSSLIWMESMHTIRVNSVVFSPDGSLIASGSSDCTILLWDVSTGTLVGEPLVGHSQVVTSLACSPDGESIASGSHDHTIRLWDIRSRVLRQPPFEGYSGVYAIAYSPNGQHIASGSKDASIRKWDTTIAGDSTDDEVSWVARKNGWVTDQNSRLLVWLPYDSRGRLFLDPRNVLSIVDGQAIVPETPNLEEFCFGEEWYRCYHGTTQ